jgi:hypothetical protein
MEISVLRILRLFRSNIGWPRCDQRVFPFALLRDTGLIE